jgi:hypothetical protein
VAMPMLVPAGAGTPPKSTKGLYGGGGIGGNENGFRFFSWVVYSIHFDVNGNGLNFPNVYLKSMFPWVKNNSLGLNFFLLNIFGNALVGSMKMKIQTQIPLE